MQDPGPVSLEAMIAAISLTDDKWDVLDVPPWKYYAEKYNTDREVEPVHCTVGWDLVKYLAKRERDR
jgi:hypothetical protein